ncbi:MAG: YceI family protein [Pseudomonadota bacterium]
MRLLLAAAASLGLATAASAQTLDVPSGTYVVDPTHTSILWKVNHLGFSNYTGTFARDAIDATITLDASDVANSSVSVTVNGQEVETLHPAAKDFNAEIESEMFINSDAHPQITFTSSSIEVTGDNTANITGELTLAGQTHPLVLETTLNGAKDHPMSGNPTIGISATGVVKRSEWGVTSLVGPIGDDVVVEIQGEFLLQN